MGVSDADITILKDGNVGIGTTAPGEKLEVYGTDGGTQILLNDIGVNSNPAILIKNDATTWKIQARGNDGDKLPEKQFSFGGEAIIFELTFICIGSFKTKSISLTPLQAECSQRQRILKWR